LDLRRALNVMRDICAGMEAAHQASVIHRDLKPSNILINDESLVKIVDFGVAAAARDMDTRLTKTGLVIGTPTYMAPEQVLGKPIDTRTDIYSLGVIMYEIMTGRPPYVGGDSMAVMYQHVQGKPQAPREFNPQLPLALSAIILKAMAADPNARFQSMAELGASVAAFKH
jgi:serine/threonine-protein kinase